MSLLDPDDLLGIDQPELVFGLVAPVGTPLSHFSSILQSRLEGRGYDVHTIRVTELMESFDLNTPPPDDKASEFQRIWTQMDRGDEVCRVAGLEAMALLVASEINGMYVSEEEEAANSGKESRQEIDPEVRSGNAYIVRQLKRRDEAIWLRRIYGRAFHLIGLSCPRPTRESYLRIAHDMSEDEAKRLIKRDRGRGEKEWGQQLRKTFYLSDLFVDIQTYEEDLTDSVKGQLNRYLKLLFGDQDEPITPTKDEYGAYVARAAALRSADLSRQVGAAILTDNGEVVSVGTNEVPKAAGGQYWGNGDDQRDFSRGFDANTKFRRESLAEVLKEIDEAWSDLKEQQKEQALDEYADKLDATTLMNLTEFGRAVHAEMEALLAAGRLGVSPRSTTLYSTVLPCHNCAKHVVGAGIKRVVFIEPYPKSRARRLHGDAIAFPEDDDQDDKVLFTPFVGVAPRRYPSLFSNTTPEGKRLKQKDHRGNLSEEPLGLRLKASPLSYIDRESSAASVARRIGEEFQISEETSNE